MASIRSKAITLLQSPPSCIAFCPDNPSQLVVGTYVLEKGIDGADTSQISEQRRTGSVILCRFQKYELTEVGTFQCGSGVLDLAFSNLYPFILCVATSTGSLLFYHVKHELGRPEYDNPGSSARQTANLADDNPPPDRRLNLQAIVQLFDKSILILDLDFHPTRPGVVGLTTSDGATYLVQIPTSTFLDPDTPSPPPTIVRVSTASLEAWTLSFNYSGTTLFSGSDDASLTTVSMPPGQDHAIPPLSNTTTIQRLHEAGVTSILPLHMPSSMHFSTPPSPSSARHTSTYVILTGGYDDRLIVSRLPRTPYARTLAELNLEGGVWRTALVHEPEIRDNERRWIVLCSCMYAGARVVEVRCRDWEATLNGMEPGVEEGGWEITVLARMEEHESMCYASAVVPEERNPSESGSVGARVRTVISTSFYDRKVCMWDFTIPVWE